jgi:hypothetical protein
MKTITFGRFAREGLLSLQIFFFFFFFKNMEYYLNNDMMGSGKIRVDLVKFWEVLWVLSFEKVKIENWIGGATQKVLYMRSQKYLFGW